jgi:3-deoxy-7-phosphoheptulonate synthase
MIFVSEFLRTSPAIRQTDNLRVEKLIPLIEPAKLKSELPLTPKAAAVVSESREAIRKILKKQDPRLLLIVGPCSIHDESAALAYAEKLSSLSNTVKKNLLVMMRTYFEKPRTNLGWKGLINDPHLDGSYDMNEGLRKARRILLKINEMGLGTATEMLDPMTPAYIEDLVSWAAIGARTTESQTHREMASALPMPVGFKNSTDGSFTGALNAMKAAASLQTFSGINHSGRACIVKTTGNSFGHLVLRGGNRPNYDSVSIEQALIRLRESGMTDAIIVDCSHGNSRKKYDRQAMVWRDVIHQRLAGNNSIIGLMLESNLCEGSQKLCSDMSLLKYGVSVTDACVSYETTEELLRYAYKEMAKIIK